MKTAEMSVIQFIKNNALRVMEATLNEYRVGLTDIVKGTRKISYGLINIVTITLLLPIYALLWPLIARKAIRDALQREAAVAAEVQGKTEIYRTPQSKFNTKFKAWILNVLVLHLGMTTILGIPDFDFMKMDSKTGDMVYYKVGGTDEQR